MQFSAIHLITGNKAYFEKAKKDLSTDFPIQVGCNFSTGQPFLTCLNRIEVDRFFAKSMKNYSPEKIVLKVLKSPTKFFQYISVILSEKKTLDSKPILISEMQDNGNAKILQFTHIVP